MKKCLLGVFLATWAMSAFAGVTVTTPSNGAVVQSPVHYVATGSSPDCAKGVAALGIYTAPYKLAYSVNGSKLDTYLTLSPGTYNTVVQQWDNCGWSAKTAITITVTGTGGGGVFADLQKSSWWNSYALLPPSYEICDTCKNTGPQVTWLTTQGISSPSLSGGSMKFDIGGTTPFADVLWNVKFTTHLQDQNIVPTLTSFTYDVYFYGTNLEKSQALEFDFNQFFGGMSFIWGHECRIAGGHEWDTWDNKNMHWVPSGIPCNPLSNAWNHLTIEVQRTSDNRLLFKTITLNDKTYTLNRYDYPSATTWYGITINYQMDGNYKQEPYTVYLDNITYTYK
jgi:hypothetical protein